MRALVVFLLFVGMQMAAGALATILPVNEGDVFIHGTHIAVSNLGLALLLCEGLFALCLYLWFYVWSTGKNRLPGKSNPDVCGPSASDMTETGNSAVNTPKYPRVALVAMAVAGVLLLALGISFISEPLQLPDNGMEASFAEMVNSSYCLLLLCLVGPLAEELVFRAGVLESLRRSGLNGIWSAVFSALAFAAVHDNLAQGVPAFIVGIVLGLLYLRTGNLRLCLPAHIANNVMGVCVMKSAFMENVSALSVWGIVTLGVILVVVGLCVLRPVLRGLRVFVSSHSEHTLY